LFLETVSSAIAEKGISKAIKTYRNFIRFPFKRLKHALQAGYRLFHTYLKSRSEDAAACRELLITRKIKQIRPA
jgi:hypothetical protein